MRQMIRQVLQWMLERRKGKIVPDGRSECDYGDVTQI